MKRWILALLFVAIAGFAVANMSFVTPTAIANSSTCTEPPDCVGQCICAQQADEDECQADYQAGLLTLQELRICLRQSRQTALQCFSQCA